MQSRGAIFGLNITYLAVLLALLLGRQHGVPVIGTLPALVAGIVPLGILWIGALGGVTASLYGVFEHMQDWDGEYRYWHIARPFVGAILATIAFLIFVGLINATGNNPDTRPVTNSVPYLVLAFIVGYRERTFRDLVKRAVDVLLGPGIPGETPPQNLEVTPRHLDFGSVAANKTEEKTVLLRNAGSGAITFNADNAPEPGLTSEPGDQITLIPHSFNGMSLAPNTTRELKVRFRAIDTVGFTGEVRIGTSAGTDVLAVSANQ